MDEIYSLYIGYAPDCTTAAAATICPHGTGKSRREKPGIDSSRVGLVPAMTGR